MDWSQVYTRTQYNALLSATKKAAEDFLDFVRRHNFVSEKDEVVIKQLAYSLVVRGGQFAEKRGLWLYLSGKDVLEFQYEPLNYLSDDLICRSYRLTPQHFLDAREAVTKKISEKLKVAVAQDDVLKDLKALRSSSKILDLICDMTIAEDENSKLLLVHSQSGCDLEGSGSAEIYNNQVELCKFREEWQYLEIIEKYQLKSAHLKDLLKKLEAS